MHMMFVDESGDKGYPKDGDWSTWRGSNLFVRLGVIIHGWKWKEWDKRLKTLKQQQGLLWDAEIKASDIHRGKGAFKDWDLPRREMFLHELVSLIGANQNITLISSVIDKKKIDLTAKERMIKPEIRSMELLLERYNKFLLQQDDRSGIVVLDPTQEKDDDNIRYFQSYLQVHSPHFKPLQIVESTFFAKSHTSSMVQVADICSNMFYRYENSPQGNAAIEFAPLLQRFYSSGNRIRGVGIKRWPE